MKPRSAIQKGKELENFVVNKLRWSGLDKQAARTPGSGNGKAKGDIWNALGLVIECKNQKKFPHDSLAQVAKANVSFFQTEVVVWHPPRTALEDSVAIMNINDLIELLKIKQTKKGYQSESVC